MEEHKRNINSVKRKIKHNNNNTPKRRKLEECQEYHNLPPRLNPTHLESTNIQSLVKTVMDGSPASDAIFTEKISGRTVSLVNPPSAVKSSKSLQAPLTSKERKVLKVFDVPDDQIVYESFVPLHQLWLQYILDVLGNSRGASQMGNKLLKADFHGCVFTVVQANVPSYIGVVGIVIQESLNCFKLVTRDNRLKVVPKSGVVFSFRIRNKRIKLHGDHFLYRSYERSTRNFKARHQNFDI
eukprot:TRINITY_DN1134_c0_g2_i1.p1 TRINITY_DN1134_c0_g2~~TRINITY_DN1134_c0_g2_i1.p1  ORF type:complete len:269 (-),score=21.58 TRINITY_DN1134_c0_g2_i1:173-892(-)